MHMLRAWQNTLSERMSHFMQRHTSLCTACDHVGVVGVLALLLCAFAAASSEGTRTSQTHQFSVPCIACVRATSFYLLRRVLKLLRILLHTSTQSLLLL